MRIQQIVIEFCNHDAIYDIHDLLFNGHTKLHADDMTLASGSTTLYNVEFDGDIRELIYGELTEVPYLWSGVTEKPYTPKEATPEIDHITLITDDGDSFQVTETALAAFQHMEFAGKIITKKEYLEIAREVHKNDHKERFLSIIENMDGCDDKQDKALDYLYSNPKEEFVEFVDDKLGELITGEDEIGVITELIENYKDTIYGNR